MAKRKSRTGAVILFFIIATVILYSIYQKQLLPMPLLIFLIGFAVIILICVGVLFFPLSGEYKVIPIKKRR